MLMRANDSRRCGGGCVAGVAGRRRNAHDEEAGERGAHALVVDVGRGGLEDLVVRFDDGGEEVVERGAAGHRLGETPLQQLDGEGAGHLAGLVPAHAVGDGEHRRLDEHAVLVLLADATGIGHHAPAQLGGGGHCASSTV